MSYMKSTTQSFCTLNMLFLQDSQQLNNIGEKHKMHTTSKLGDKNVQNVHRLFDNKRALRTCSSHEMSHQTMRGDLVLSELALSWFALFRPLSHRLKIPQGAVSDRKMCFSWDGSSLHKNLIFCRLRRSQKKSEAAGSSK